MSKETNIAWTDHTFNPWWGCEKVSPGCKNCYAESLASRYGHDVWGPGKPRRQFKMKHWEEPLRWNDAGPSRVFCGSMCDVFEDHPTANEERERLRSLIRLTPNLTWQLLTKRPENILREDWGSGWPNVWFGTSVENQEWAEKRIPHLLKVPAAVRFLSAEPLLGPIQFTTICGLSFNRNPDHTMARPDGEGISWVIFGGESGPGFRECNPDWIKSGVSQCKAASVAAFVKQDSGRKPGQQGRLSDELFNTKEFPIP
jgi:protein gp37